MDMKKEIKLSDLFRRKPKPEATETSATPDAEKKPGRFGRRKGADGDASPAEKPRRESRRSRKRGGSPPPDVPLMRAFDLMPSDDDRGGSEGRRPKTVELVLAVVGLVAVAVLTSVFLITNATVADKQQSLNTLKTRLAALDVAAEEPKPQGPDAVLVQERDTRTSALSKALGTRVAWDRLMRNLSLVLPDDVWLAGLNATSAAAPSGTTPVDPSLPLPTSTIEITGFTRKQESVAQLLSRLAVVPEIASVQLTSSTATTIGDEDVIQFVIAATLKVNAVAGATP